MGFCCSDGFWVADFSVGASHWADGSWSRPYLMGGVMARMIAEDRAASKRPRKTPPHTHPASPGAPLGGGRVATNGTLLAI